VSTTGIGSDLVGKAAGGRKLIAIVYADMVGYSRLIGSDDAGTLRRLRTLRRALIDPAIREHGGRVVQTAGDSLLVVFDSIDGAVRCAVKVQQQVPVYDGDQPPDRRIRFRVGINIGDVIAHGTDLHGDGVNVAARLETQCPVGGICASRAVRDHLRGRLDLPFEPIGELTLKNVARPVEAFVLRLDPSVGQQSGGDTGPASRTEAPRTRGRIRVTAVAVVALFFICAAAAAGWWWFVRVPSDGTQSAGSQASRPVAVQTVVPPDVGLSHAPRLSLVVLPLNNLGGDGVSDDVVDGITDDLTTELSRLPGFLVIARNSAFTYKGKPIDVKRVGEELGVRYALEGSVRKTGDVLRVNAQLVSTETGTHLWADRFDVARDGVGYGVDDIVRQIGLALNVRLVEIEGARSARERPTNPDAADVLLQARALDYRPVTPQTQREVVALYERAVELDPSSAVALAGLADALLNSTPSEDPANAVKIRRAEELITRAELLRPDLEIVMWARVFLLGSQKRCPELIPAAQKLNEAYPNGTGGHYRLGICLVVNGRAADAIAEFEQALRINPRNPQNFNRYRNIGYALIFLEKYDDAVASLERALAANPNDSAWYRGDLHAAIAAAQALAGHAKEAQSSAAEAMRLNPTLTVRSYSPRSYSADDITNPVAAAQVAHMRDGMILAGIRDHADEDADFGLASDNVLHTDYVAPTPTAAPGVRTIRTPDLRELVEQRKPLILDTIGGRSIPGAVGLWGAGIGGNVHDEYQDRLGRKMQQLTGGSRDVPVVTMDLNAERFQGRNLALRLVALGYTNVYWYRGGREAWEVAGLPEAPIGVQDW
jgi:TolB-like protein/class 3 adenylate cyclase/tetratricopeptide (TPR) repeat protein